MFKAKIIEDREQWALILGDCAEALKTIGEASIDAVVTDPPAGIGFMGKEWDDFRRSRNNSDTARDNVGGRLSRVAPEIGRRSRIVFIHWLSAIMCECLRVLKPGGHALVWAIPRTSHWTATALEDAGFEIRDCIYHVFGTGFPKAADVGKDIDKRLGAQRVVVGKNPNHRAVSGVDYEGVYAGGNTGSKDVFATTSKEAKQWGGWATTLKPAVECWWLVRKPLTGTVASNVLEHGTGALNIDACRVTTGDKLQRKLGKTTESASGWKSTNRSEIAGKDGGRWPANLIHDGSDEVVSLFPRSKGQQGSVTGKEPSAKTNGVYGEYAERSPCSPRGDNGSAARFFYCAKGSRKEKDAGIDGKNTHSTVKSIELMRYLCRLVTPPGGVVLDPFAGSGSTGCAARLEGFGFLGIEQEREYFDIAKERIAYWEVYCSTAIEKEPSRKSK